MGQRIKKVIVISAVVLAVGCAYAIFYSLAGLGIPCPFHLITGLKCPGCGVTRMLVSLIKLDVRAAFGYNAALLIMLPVLLYLLGAGVYRFIRFGTKRLTKAETAIEWALVGLLVVWGVVRNVIGK